MSFSQLQTYANFARAHARRFVSDRIEERRRPVLSAPHRPRPEEWPDDRLTVAWLGHATVLMNFYGTWLLTDPALGSRVGVRLAGMTLGPHRLVRSALTAREIPKLDAILISHAHMDHCDLPTLRRLSGKARGVVVQRGNTDLVPRRFARTDELAWGESVEINGARIEAIETLHWGARKLTDAYRGYGGFFIEKNGEAVVFAGDTAYTRAFGRLKHRVAKITLAIMPIGAYDPYIRVHANPEQAWAMAREMNAEYVLPIHHSTFRLSCEPTSEPIARFCDAARSESWRIAATEVGETWQAKRAKLKGTCV